MAKTKSIMKEFEDEVVKQVTKVFKDISSIDEEGIREGFYIKGSKYKALGSGMKQIMNIITPMIAPKYLMMMEGQLLEDEAYAEHKKAIFTEEYTPDATGNYSDIHVDYAWDEYVKKAKDSLKEKNNENKRTK